MSNRYLFLVTLLSVLILSQRLGFAKERHDAFACIDVRLMEGGKTMKIVGISVEPSDGSCDAFGMVVIENVPYYVFKTLDAKKQVVDSVDVSMSTELVASAEAKNVKSAANAARTIKLSLGTKRARPVFFQVVDPGKKVIFEKDFLTIFANDFLDENTIEVFQPSLKFNELASDYHSGKKSPRQAISQMLSKLKDCKTVIAAEKYRGFCETTKRIGKYALEKL